MGALGISVRAPSAAADGRPADSEPATHSTRRPWLSRYRWLIALVGLAAVMSVVVRHVVYPAFSWNRDEVAYLWQISVLRGGHFLAPTAGWTEFFHPWLAGTRDGSFFSQYTVGWPAVMLVADLLGNVAGAIVFGVVLAVVGTYAFTREITRDHTLAIVTTALVTVSPFVVIQSGVYLGYLFSLGIGLLFGAALLAGLRRADWRLVALAGALLGYLFVTRPFDAVLWGGAVGAYALLVEWGRWRALFRAALVVGLTFLPFLVWTLFYNRAVTGSATQFPFTAKDPLDTFGFGARRVMPATDATNFTWKEAVRGEARNLFYFPQFLFGAYLGVAVAAVGLWLRRRERSTVALLLLATVFPLGYFMFWGIRLSSFYAFLSAPFYFLALYITTCLLVGTVILTAWRHRRWIAVLLCGALALSTAPFLVSRARSNHRISAAQQQWRAAADTLGRDSLVFVANSGAYLMFLNPYSRNTPNLDGPILYATDRPTAMLDLMAAYPEREPYLELTSDPAIADPFRHPNPAVPEITLIPLAVLPGRQFALRVRYTVTTRDPVVVASLRVGAQVETRVLATDATRGSSYETEWRVGVAGDAGVVPLTRTGGRVVVRVGAGPSPDTALRGAHSMLQYPYRVAGARAELLNPPRSIAVERDSGTRVRRETTALPELAADVVVNG